MVAVWIIIGAIVGFILACIATPKMGTLIIDENNFNKDVYRIELDRDPTTLKNYKSTILKIYVIK